MTDVSASPIKVDIWSDVQRPWCCIGKRTGMPVEQVTWMFALVTGIAASTVQRSCVLTDETYPAKVKADIAQAAAYGIQGVPFFVIDGTYGISGVQDATTFATVLERAITERDADR